VTIFALLEMHKRGEASWDQSELFGPIKINPLEVASETEEVA
jgi:chromatin segregation and condensation protein Rec8/ScpA/Scc1 (kleisin family)